PYDGRFYGEGTVYGEAPVGSGNCAIREPLPSMYDGMIPVALNDAQYGNSEMCGACIKGKGDRGEFRAYVMDRCPECAHGDLDFAMGGTGRWNINWRFVPCDDGDDPTFIFEGSNAHYWKIQPRGSKSPVEKLWVNGEKATRTQDNFFVIQGDEPYDGDQEVKTKTFLRKRKKTKVSL
ncbi:unnamed protein product, partial [Ascophyllum nodosum]